MPIPLKALTDEIERQKQSRPDRITSYRSYEMATIEGVLILEVNRPLDPSMDPNQGVMTIYSEIKRIPGEAWTFDERDVYKAFDGLNIHGDDTFTKSYPRPWENPGQPEDGRLHYGEPHFGQHREGEHGK